MCCVWIHIIAHLLGINFALFTPVRISNIHSGSSGLPYNDECFNMISRLCVTVSYSLCHPVALLPNGVVFQRHYRPSEQCSQVANPRDFSMCHSHNVTICSTLIVSQCHTVTLYHMVSILSVSHCFIMVIVSVSLCVRRLVPHVCHVEVASYCQL